MAHRQHRRYWILSTLQAMVRGPRMLPSLFNLLEIPVIPSWILLDSNYVSVGDYQVF